MKRKSRPESGMTLINLHALLLTFGLAIIIFVSLDLAGRSPEDFQNMIRPYLVMCLVGWVPLFLAHLYSHHLYMAREQQREAAYFESLRLQEERDELTEADGRR